MAEAIGALRAELSATAAQFEKDMGRAAKALGMTKQSFESLQHAALLASTAIAATMTAFAAIAKSTADAGDQIAKMSRQLGMSAEDLSALGHASDLAGVPLEGLQTALRTLAVRMQDASQGSAEAQRTLAELGVSVREGDKSLPPLLESLLKASNRLGGMSDATKRAALAQEAFGRQGLTLIPLLEGGSAAIREQMEEAKALGIVWGTDAAKAAEAFNDNLTRMGKAFEGLKLSLGNALIPGLNDLAERFVTMAKTEEFREWVDRMAAGMGTLAKLLIETLPPALQYSMAGLRAFGTLVLAEAAGVETLANAILKVSLAVHSGGLAIRELLGIESSMGVSTEDVRKKVDSLTASIEKNRETIALLSKGMEELAFGKFPTLPPSAAPGAVTSSPTPGPASPALPEAGKKRAGDAYYEAAKAELAFLDQASETGKQYLAQEWAAAAELQKIQEGITQGFISSWVARIDAQKALEHQAAIDEVARLQEVAKVRESLSAQEFENLKWSLGVKQEAWGFYFKFLKDEYEHTSAAIAQDVEAITAPLFRALKGAVQGILEGTQTLEEGFRRMGQNIAAALMETVIDTGLKEISKALVTFAQSMSSSGGSSWGGILSVLGQVFGSLAGARAGGGPVNAGSAYLVGERGPELFVPNTGGEIMAHGAMGAPTINIDARKAERGVSVEIMQAIRSGMGQAVNISMARIQDQRRRGGMRGLG